MKSRRMVWGIAAGLMTVAALCPSALAEGKRFSLGLNAGGGAITSVAHSWRVGFELGFRPVEQMALTAGAATAESRTSFFPN